MILPAGTFSACYFFGVLVSKLMVTDLDDLGETVLELWNGHVTRGWELWVVGWQQQVHHRLYREFKLSWVSLISKLTALNDNNTPLVTREMDRRKEPRAKHFCLSKTVGGRPASPRTPHRCDRVSARSA